MEYLKAVLSWLQPGVSPDVVVPALIGASAGVGTLVIGYVLQRLALSRSKKDQFDQLQKEKSALIAELLASWIFEEFDRDKTNRLLFEASLWLPKGEAESLNKLFAHDTDAPKIREVLQSSRKIIHGKRDKMIANDFVIMPCQ